LRIRYKGIAGGLFVFSIFGSLTYGLGWSNLLAIKAISYNGTDHISLINDQLVESQSRLVIGTPLARINPRTEENTIARLEWVKEVTVNRDWITGEVKVDIKPRIAVAVFRENSPRVGPPRYLGGDGTEFTSPINFKDLASITLQNQSLADRELVATFVSNLPPDLLKTLLGLEVSDASEIFMTTNLKKSGLRINWGSGNSSSDIRVKSGVLRSLLALRENRRISEVNLSLAHSPIVK
jgi:cell division septal protein FtsQ